MRWRAIICAVYSGCARVFKFRACRHSSCIVGQAYDRRRCERNDASGESEEGKSHVQRHSDERANEGGREQRESWAAGGAWTLSARAKDFRGEAPKAMGLSIPCVSWYVTAACFRRCRKVGRVARARTGCNRQRKLGTGSASLSVFANGGASARALRGGDHARDHATNAGSRSRRSNETQGPLLVSSRLVRAQVRPK